MASSIPRATRKRYADSLAGTSMKVALFVDITGYAELTATTYTALDVTATEVSSVGTGYTTGGYTLTLSSANLATNGAKVDAVATSVAAATFTCRYAVIYINAAAGTDYIVAVSDFGSNYTVTNGTITITWDATDGLISIQ